MKLPRRSKVWTIGLCALLAVIGVLGAYFGDQVLEYYRVLRPRFAMYANPAFTPRGLNSTPEPLADSTALISEGTVLSYYGYRFEVSWKGIITEKNPINWEEAEFKDGQRVEFADPNYFQKKAAMAGARANHSAEDEARESIFRQSQYEQYKTMLSMTPSQLSPFCSHLNFARAMILFERKAFMFEHNVAPPDIFSFETPNYRGFEISGLSRGWQHVTILLFDTHDHTFQWIVSVNRDSTAKLTQPEINRIIQSFGPA